MQFRSLEMRAEMSFEVIFIGQSLVTAVAESTDGHDSDNSNDIDDQSDESAGDF